jgi:hypothetical protein
MNECTCKNHPHSFPWMHAPERTILTVFHKCINLYKNRSHSFPWTQATFLTILTSSMNACTIINRDSFSWLHYSAYACVRSILKNSKEALLLNKIFPQLKQVHFYTHCRLQITFIEDSGGTIRRLYLPLPPSPLFAKYAPSGSS